MELLSLGLSVPTPQLKIGKPCVIYLNNNSIV